MTVPTNHYQFLPIAITSLVQAFSGKRHVWNIHAKGNSSPPFFDSCCVSVPYIAVTLKPFHLSSELLNNFGKNRPLVIVNMVGLHYRSAWKYIIQKYTFI